MNRLKSFIIFILLLFANSIHAQDDCYKIDSIKNRIIFYVEGHIGSEKRDIMLDKVVKNLDWYIANTDKSCDKSSLQTMRRLINNKEPIARIIYLYDAQNGDKETQYKLGRCYYDGTMEAANDINEAMEWFKKAANQGHRESAYYLGNILYNTNNNDAIVCFSKALPYADAYYMLGYCYELGKCGLQQNYKSARENYEKARNGIEHSADALYRLGLLYENGQGGPKDVKKAIGLFQDATGKGQQAAKQLLDKAMEKGRHYFEANDYASAREWFKLTKSMDTNHYLNAMNGDPFSTYWIGNKYYKEKNYTVALRCFDVVVNYLRDKQYNVNDKDLYNAAFAMGACYENEWGVAKDLSKAMDYYTIAAEGGIAAAQYNLSNYYRKEKDYEKEVELLTKAANSGLANAQYNLGIYYDTGYKSTKPYGIKQDKSKAIEWLQKAANQGHEKAKEKLNSLRK